MSRTCKQCGGPNDRAPQARYCSTYCAQKSYRRSDKGRLIARGYRISENGQMAMKRNRATLYGITVSRLEELLAAGCYAPGCENNGSGVTGLHIDHDHSHCPGKGSCGSCVRGALCQRHNTYLGYLESDWKFAIWAMRQPSLVMKIRREA